ncbi:uncharacterized protein Z519_00184 [Cladophialophora bantiana CBS 173.52]|uniref:Uncharacterized protein n=1 Tax=Cladophialophora bantiana (strain ATCC 10958 / CBS 173.52 / CDC B-1940 / NIH 8579) TaxID=1442370 RepID=A0A0D2HYM2_CLAB1|nr:uncharacterized protein Z519_00184 [Cladophialophora bantiana CBS 173.52]KIW98523.1 hypothetical protein Z519_00184 [Cladophialophora bantiana CBS 173.52]
MGRERHAPPPTTTANESGRRKIRPNHFHDLGDFIEGTDASNPSRDLTLGWASGHEERLTPGTIIYIRDNLANSRINDTVMLVLRRSTDTQSSLTCLSFCAHHGRKLSSLYKTHRLVVPPAQPARTVTPSPRQQGPVIANTRDGGLNLRGVEVELYTNGFRPKPELTLNCEELWNVEREVDVAVIGEVTAPSFREVVAHVKKLFCDSLDQAVDNEDDPPAVQVTPASSAPARSRTNDTARAVRYRDEDRRRERRDEGRSDRHNDREAVGRGEPSDKTRRPDSREKVKRYRLEKRAFGPSILVPID